MERTNKSFPGSGRWWASPAGYTLLEVITILVVLGVLLSAARPVSAGLLDGIASARARDSVMALIHRASREAVTKGGARVVLKTRPSSVELWAGGALLVSLDLEKEFQVEMALSREREEAVLLYGPMGLGQVAGQTIRFRRGAVELLLSVSSYGRVSRP